MKVAREGRRLIVTEIGPHPDGFELPDKLTVAINYTPGDENVSPLDKALALDGVILPAIMQALRWAGMTDKGKPEPYVYQPEHGELELVIRDDYHRPEPAVYVTVISENLEVVGHEEYEDEDAARAAWPNASWREGDKEDGCRVLAVGHYRPEETEDEDND